MNCNCPQGLEEQLTARFSSNPQSEFVAEDLSSFERLLVHALASYNSLNSHSFDFAVGFPTIIVCVFTTVVVS